MHYRGSPPPIGVYKTDNYGYIQFTPNDLKVDTVFDCIFEQQQGYWKKLYNHINDNLLQAPTTHHHDPSDDLAVDKCPNCGQEMP